MDDRMEKFIAVVETGSFTGAAKQLHVSQPALTVAIAKLEKVMDATLIERGRKELSLTPAGRLVYDSAVRQALLMSNLRMRLGVLAGVRQKFAIGMIDSVADRFCDDMTIFGELERELDMTIIVNNSRILATAVKTRQIDVALVVGTVQTADFVTENLGSEQLVLVASPGIAAAVESQIASGRIEHFISYDRGSHTSQTIAGYLEAARITPDTLLYSTSSDVMAKMVLADRGAAVLPRTVVKAYLATNEMVEVGADTLGYLTRPISSITLPGKVLPSGVGGFFMHAANLLKKA